MLGFFFLFFLNPSLVYIFLSCAPNFFSSKDSFKKIVKMSRIMKTGLKKNVSSLSEFYKSILNKSDTFKKKKSSVMYAQFFFLKKIP